MVSNAMVDTWRLKYPYIVATIGVALLVISTMIDLAGRAFSSSPTNRQFGNMTGIPPNPNLSGMPPNAMIGFRGPDILTLVALVIAVSGIVWLGFSMSRESHTQHKSEEERPQQDAPQPVSN